MAQMVFPSLIMIPVGRSIGKSTKVEMAQGLTICFPDRFVIGKTGENHDLTAIFPSFFFFLNHQVQVLTF